jgi:hypothetical protein
MSIIAIGASKIQTKCAIAAGFASAEDRNLRREVHVLGVAT